mgnify:CR=1 FL=1
MFKTQKGGKYLGSGTFGCVISPNIKCQNKAQYKNVGIEDKNLISKLSTYKYYDSENLETVYDEINIPRIINAAGSMTYLGGSLIHPEVLETMRQAGEAYVFIDDLLDWASSEIKKHTGAEAGLVTTGTTGGLVLSAAACLTGMDAKRMREIPNTSGWANEFIIQSQHRISFDRAIRTAGGKIVEVGCQNRTQVRDIHAGIGEKTIGILYMALDPQPSASLKEPSPLQNPNSLAKTSPFGCNLLINSNVAFFL